MLTANELKGRATGVEFLSFFAGVWLFFAMVSRGVLDATKGALVVVGVLALVAAAEWVRRQARRYPRFPEDPAVKRAFRWINAAQWAAGFALYFALQFLHRGDYFMPGLAAIVGLHFLPLAKLFRAPANYAVGGLMVVWSAVSMAFVPVEHLPSTSAFGTGLILWQAAATTLAVSVAVARQPVSQAAEGFSAPAP